MMKILVRLPNWLGDVVMSAGMLQQLRYVYPEASISVVVKKGLEELLPFFPPLEHQFIFSKKENAGLRGAWSFGRSIRRTWKFDLFFCLPDSMSSAMMGFASGARQRIGFSNEGRSPLLTHAYRKPSGKHRVDEYCSLVEKYSQQQTHLPTEVRLQHNFEKKAHVVININSEASSRRLTMAKAVELITAVRANISHELVLIGGAGEQTFVETVFDLLSNKEGIRSVAGRTTLTELCGLLASAQAVLSTDSGPAHLANAIGTNTLVLFGAGNENNTAPYHKEISQTVRLGKLSCEPCTCNICVRFGVPQCLELLETQMLVQALQQKINIL